MLALPRLLLVMLAALLAQPLQAHLTPNSEMQFDFGRREVLGDLIIPAGEYAYATGNPTGNDPASLKRAEAFLRRNINVTAKRGAAWKLTVERLEFAQIAGPPDLHAVLRLTPPAGASARQFDISWRAVIDRVPNHFVLFVARSDFSRGTLDGGREILGALQGSQGSLSVDRGKASLTDGFRAAVGLGMRHIAEGYDHLLFLIVLLLPAPLLAAGRRWGENRPIGSTLWHLIGIVSAFTIGHSLTLIGAAVFDWRLPVQPVEILIACSILISAIHALRPLFPGHEARVAGWFGLVHGLAFATTVSHFGLGMEEKALAILGFNIGIELVQLAVVLSIMPALLLLVHTSYYKMIRRVTGGLAAIAAIAWLIERVFGAGNAFTAAMESAFRYAPWVVGTLTLFGVVIHTKRHLQSSRIIKSAALDR
ncbi:hypothetical protein C1T17_12300 [Sphingobium sp. SCG-1]|uniref:HupE/UreJ family protein n=1 Tax=Sphingobium sp. SCG-1 TaxID=2072936 RepID=UPI000CD6AB7C|nr:HupE/UreJ family protein [Sphingobium sp. SCG-1]AUW58760.1 hypothetical protein C1T17_12300 [Sphingobium sp. SCG-1]